MTEGELPPSGPDLEPVAGPGPESGAEARIRALEEAVSARDLFLSVVGHELRNPMQPIALQTDLLRAAAERGDLARVTAGLVRLQASIEQYVRRATVLLDVSRLLSGRFRLESVSVDLAAMVWAAAGRFAEFARIAGSNLEVAAPESLTGLFDPIAVEQITENLISNAVKYGAGKPVRVLLAQEGREAVLTVRDGGIGIAPEDRARIFDHFERAVERRRHGGFGVGLWIVNQLVTAMGGRITLASALGEGSTFTVRLPLDGGQAER